NNLLWRLALFEEFFHDSSIVDFGLEGSSVEEVQGLGKIGINFDFAGANCGARSSTEGGEKIVGGIAVGDFDGPRAARKAGEFVLCLGHLTDAIEEHFSTDAADAGFAEVAIVGGVGCIWMGAELIGAGSADVADDT